MVKKKKIPAKQKREHKKEIRHVVADKNGIAVWDTRYTTIIELK